MIVEEDWVEIYGTECPSMMTDLFNAKLDSLFNKAFPVKTRKIKDTDDPWITPEIRTAIRLRKRIFARYGRSEEWHAQKKVTDMLIKTAKELLQLLHKEISTKPRRHCTLL